MEVHADFAQRYTRGKIFLQQKLYKAARKELAQAAQMAQGKKHFGVMYFLGISHYRLGQIGQAMATWKSARARVSNGQQRKVLNRVMRRARALFGPFRIVTQVDPDQVGRLRVKLTVKNPFSHPQKRRIYRVVRRRWLKQGVALQGKTLYLPRADYELSILQPQCLRYALTVNDFVSKTLTIKQSATVLTLQEKPSCRCLGGQVARKSKRGEVACVCPKGSAWSQKTSRCEIPKKTRSWIASNWWWVTLASVGVVAGGSVALYFLLAPPAREPPVKINGNKLF